jgi:hypothetical protein
MVRRNFGSRRFVHGDNFFLAFICGEITINSLAGGGMPRFALTAAGQDRDVGPALTLDGAPFSSSVRAMSLR